MKLEALLKLPSTLKEFLAQTDTIDPHTLIRQYAEYMLSSASAWKLPVDIDGVIRHHGFRQLTGPRNESLGRRGMLVGSAIAVNTDDPITVQRYSKAHELVEALFVALRQEKPCRFAPDVTEVLWQHKELWCELGAAEFLLPADLFFPAVRMHRAKLALALQWAQDFQVSLTATIRRMLDANVSPCIFLQVRERDMRWHGFHNMDRHVLQVMAATRKAPPELYVMRQWRSPQTSTLVMLNESISEKTSIHRTFQAGVFGKVEACNDLLDFRYVKSRCHTESVLVRINGTPIVMVLIHPRNLN